MADREWVGQPTGCNAAAARPGKGLERRLCRPLGAAAILLATLSACSSSTPTHHAAAPAPVVSAEQQREYAPPGPVEDPWGPYIREASQRYDFPEGWIRAVMRQESGGHEYINGSLTTSASGAIGLMQVMPETYANLRDRYGLGPDPYYPRDNILAGTAYLKELYTRFGSPGFLAAYNGGPQRLADHLATGRPLPSETVAYVAAIGPRIGAPASVPGGSGGYAVAASTAATDALNRQALANATGSRPAPAPQTAYVPSAPIYHAPQTSLQTAPAPATSMAPAARYALVSPPPPPAPPPSHAPALLPDLPPAVAAVLASAEPSGGGWGIQVGAFSSPALAQAATDNARAHAHGQLAAAHTAMPVTTRPDGVVLYRARLIGISADAASTVCNNLAHDQVSCIVVNEDHA